MSIVLPLPLDLVAKEGTHVPGQLYEGQVAELANVRFSSQDGLQLATKFGDLGALEVTTDGLDLETAWSTTGQELSTPLSVTIQPAVDHEIPFGAMGVELIKAEPGENYVSDWIAEGRLNLLQNPAERPPSAWGILLASPLLAFRSGDRDEPLTMEMLEYAPLGVRFSLSGDPVASFRLAVKSVVVHGLVGAVLSLPDGQRTIAPEENLLVQVQRGKPGRFAFDSVRARIDIDAPLEAVKVDGRDIRPRRINLWPWYFQAAVWAVFGYLLAPWLSHLKLRS
jgi:hypothetical protein